MNIKAGQKVYVTYNDSRYEYKNQYVTITKVGRKYFYLQFSYGRVIKCDKKTMQDVGGRYGNEFTVYKDEQAYLDFLEKRKLTFEISRNILRINLPLNVLRKIVGLMEEV
jgi:hypothetical protein